MEVTPCVLREIRRCYPEDRVEKQDFVKSTLYKKEASMDPMKRIVIYTSKQHGLSQKDIESSEDIHRELRPMLL